MGKKSGLDDRTTNVAVVKKPKTNKAVVVKKKTAAPPSADKKGLEPTDAINCGSGSGNTIREASNGTKEKEATLQSGSKGNVTPSPQMRKVQQSLADGTKKVEELTALVKKAKAEVQSRKNKELQEHLEAGNIKALQSSLVQKSSSEYSVVGTESASLQTAETTSTGKPPASAKVKKISIRKKSKAAIEKEIADYNPGEALSGWSSAFDISEATESRKNPIRATDEDVNGIVEMSSNVTRKKKKEKAKSFSVATILEILPRTNDQKPASLRSLDVSTAASSNPSPGVTPTDDKRKKKKKIKVLRKTHSADTKPSSKESVLSGSDDPCLEEEPTAGDPDGIRSLERSASSLQSASSSSPGTKSAQGTKKKKKEKQRSLMASVYDELISGDTASSRKKSVLHQPLNAGDNIDSVGNLSRPISQLHLEKGPNVAVCVTNASVSKKRSANAPSSVKVADNDESRRVGHESLGSISPVLPEKGSNLNSIVSANSNASSIPSPRTPVGGRRKKKEIQSARSLLVDLGDGDESEGLQLDSLKKQHSASAVKMMTPKWAAPGVELDGESDELGPSQMGIAKTNDVVQMKREKKEMAASKLDLAAPMHRTAISKHTSDIHDNSSPSLSLQSPGKCFRRSLSMNSPLQSPMNDPNSLMSRFGGAGSGGRSPKTPARRGVRADLMRNAEAKASDSAATSPQTPLAPAVLYGLLGATKEMPLVDIQTPSDGGTEAPTSVMSKRHLFESLFEQKSTAGGTPGRNGMAIPDDISMTPRTLKKGFVALNLATPVASRKSMSAPPKRIFDGNQHDQDRSEGYANSAMSILSDRSKEQEIRDLVRKIDAAGGFPATRRLSMRDNELVGRMTMAIRNDPSITSIEVTPDVFGTISSTLLAQFIDALRINLHVKSLHFRGVELGNDFLYSLATSMESNFVIEEIDLSMNLFTNAGLAEFCQAVACSNDTCTKLNLENQTTPISNASEFFVLEAFRENNALNEVKLDFQSEDAANELEQIVQRNRSSPRPAVDMDDKLLTVLRYEAERAQELWKEQNEEETVLQIQDHDWDHLYELSLLFDKRKLKKVVQEAAEEEFVPATQKRNGDSMSREEKKAFLFGEFRKNLGESIGCFNSDGSFLTDEFIAKFFKEIPEEESLTFDFHGQWKLFKRFPIHDPDRATIVNKFVDALVSHSRAKEITGINMANTGCGDDFLIALSDRCLADRSLLPNLYMINFETNFINEDGVVAIAKLIASPNSLKYLQVIRLEVSGSVLCADLQSLSEILTHLSLSLSSTNRTRRAC
jgi:hypothetical protein